MTPDKLRKIARTLDICQGMILKLLSSDSKIEIHLHGEPASDEWLADFKAWVSGTEMQDDLCRWADILEDMAVIPHD